MTGLYTRIALSAIAAITMAAVAGWHVALNFVAILFCTLTMWPLFTRATE